MKYILSLIILIQTTLILSQVNSGKPIVKPKVLTLTNGKYPEFHSDDSLQKIGSVIINMNTETIYEFVTDTVYSEATLDPTIINRWYSVDPVSHPWQSPYCAMDNNPILYNDPDGRSAGVTITESKKDAKGNTVQRGTVNVNMKVFLYGEVGPQKYTADDAMFQQAMLKQNLQNVSTIMVNGEEYDLVWDVSVGIETDNSNIRSNLSQKYNPVNNYARVLKYNNYQYTTTELDKTLKNKGVGGKGFKRLQYGGKHGYVSEWNNSKGRNTGTLILDDLLKDYTVLSHELLHGLGIINHSAGDATQTFPDLTTAPNQPANQFPNMSNQYIKPNGTVDVVNNRLFTQQNLMDAFSASGFNIGVNGLNINFSNGSFKGSLGNTNSENGPGFNNDGKPCNVSEW